MPLGKVIFGLKIFLYPVERRIKRKEGEKENIFSLWIKNWRGKKKKARLLTAFRDFLDCYGQIGLLAEKGRKNQSSATFEFGINPTYQKSGE